MDVAAGTGHDGRRVTPETRQVSVAELDTVNREHAGIEHTQSLEVLDGTHARRTPVGWPAPKLLEDVPNRAGPAAQKLHLFRRLSKMHTRDVARMPTEILIN